MGVITTSDATSIHDNDGDSGPLGVPAGIKVRNEPDPAATTALFQSVKEQRPW